MTGEIPEIKVRHLNTDNSHLRLEICMCGDPKLAQMLHWIQGKPIIQQRILPSPAVSIPMAGPTHAPGDENTNIIFSPWKAFGPFVDTIQDGEVLPSQDTVMFPTSKQESLDEDVTDPIPTSTRESSNKVASISQLSFLVRPDSFERGQLRLTCVSTVHSVYNERAELVINEERPQIASVLGTRDRCSGK
ncbi:unnamed protein product [Pieris macdunnoughi]|uniref:Uncharacterized protein n=1 Tax=Pieris macdunnoughi TaxID=345717 RepID=A0A821LTI0_9NEOP|nr:unnamed protein product [Pieris macdunnoughi]